ncbi:hypothetical protein [Arcobacter sp. F2176]|nr:hypothetical protein [Arcobacter sp. F2176]
MGKKVLMLFNLRRNSFLNLIIAQIKRIPDNIGTCAFAKCKGIVNK